MNGFLALAVFVGLIAALQLQARWIARGTLPKRASRKLGHVGLGTVLIVSWPWFGTSPTSRYFAAAPAFGLALYFLALGLGAIRDDAVIRAAARDGDRRELLAGPMLYVIPFGLLVAVFGPSVVAASALACLVYGDAMAEVAGRGLRTPRLPWSREKTWGGLAGAWVGGLVGSAAVLLYLGAFGALDAGVALPSASSTGLRLAAVAGAGALVESVSSGDLDNLTIVIGTMVAALLLF